MNAKRTSTKKHSLASNMAQLEEISKWFEREEITIEEALPKFEQGLKLASECKRELEEAENRVKEIQVKFSKMIEE